MIRPFSAALIVTLSACDGGGGTTGSGGSATTSSSSASSTSSSSTSGTGGSGGGGQGGATGGCASCAGACVDLQNDAQNCGACGVVCDAKQHCDRGACASPICLVQGPICPQDHVCCGNACCPAWKMCCNVPGAAEPACVSIDAGACPTSCTACGG